MLNHPILSDEDRLPSPARAERATHGHGGADRGATRRLLTERDVMREVGP